MGNLWNLLLHQPLLQAMLLLYKLLFNNFGLAVLAITVIIRAILIPVSMPALKSQKKINDLKPHLDALKEKHGNDKKRLQSEQLRLYKEHGVNPLAGCLPMIVQFAVLIALYNVFNEFLLHGKVDGMVINMRFLWLDLSKPDKTYFLPILAGVTQLIYSLMMMPPKTTVVKQLVQKEQKKEEDMQEAMQKQMLFMMPAMTVIIGVSLPSGLALYWVATTVFSLIQQYFVTGWGGLFDYLNKIKY